SPPNYVELNQLSKDFGKRFVPQQELSAEQAFWLQTLHPNTDQYDISPVKIKAPKELTKVRLVNTSLQKLKYHLGNFDIVVKKRITPDAIIEGSWGFEHTKAIFLNEVWKSVQYGVSKGLDTTYWGFLGVETTLDIFQNIHILYLRYNVLTSSGYGVLSFIPLWSLVSAGTETPYLP
ncbi:hypothetical protein Tco_1452058, partial [Tanacetum coccineum]